MGLPYQSDDDQHLITKDVHDHQKGLLDDYQVLLLMDHRAVDPRLRLEHCQMNEVQTKQTTRQKYAKYVGKDKDKEQSRHEVYLCTKHCSAQDGCWQNLGLRHRRKAAFQ